MNNMEWKECTLGDVCDLVAGYAFKSADFGNYNSKVIKITHITPPRVDEASLAGVDISKYDASKLEKYVVRSGDYVFAMTGATIGKIGRLYKGEAFINQRILTFRNKESIINKDFLYYVLLKDDFAKYVYNHIDSESAQPNISANTVAKYTFNLPPIEKQKEIAQILSSLDDIIELNNAINRNLEEQAQILFKNYEENKPSNLMKIADVAEINPDSFGLKDDWSFVNYLDTSSITQNVISELQYINLNEEKLPSRAKRKVMENDIVYSTVRPNQLHFGFINEVKPNMLVSTGFAVIRSKNPLVSNEYIYLNLTKRDTIEKLQQIAEQSVSTFPAIKPSDIGDCLINVFEKKDAEILNDQLSAVFKKISQNNQENQRLALIRDTLLPKLMSGEMGAMV